MVDVIYTWSSTNHSADIALSLEDATLQENNAFVRKLIPSCEKLALAIQSAAGINPPMSGQELIDSISSSICLDVQGEVIFRDGELDEFNCSIEDILLYCDAVGEFWSLFYDKFVRGDSGNFSWKVPRFAAKMRFYDGSDYKKVIDDNFDLMERWCSSYFEDIVLAKLD